MSKCILICDDDQDLLDVTTIVLRKQDYNIETLKVCTKKGLTQFIVEINPDVILMDLRMPEIGGKEATLQIKRNKSTQKIPVILFSANHDIKKIANEVGADDCLQKPFDIRKMVEMVKKYA